ILGPGVRGPGIAPLSGRSLVARARRTFGVACWREGDPGAGFRFAAGTGPRGSTETYASGSVARRSLVHKRNQGWIVGVRWLPALGQRGGATVGGSGGCTALYCACRSAP